jgi:hypothetical protein
MVEVLGEAKNVNPLNGSSTNVIRVDAAGFRDDAFGLEMGAKF